LAADPTNVKFPATVLTHARISHALSGLAPVFAADAASLGPSNITVDEHTKPQVAIIYSVIYKFTTEKK